MLRKLITVMAVAALIATGFGCRKKTAAGTAPQKTEVKSQAEYNEMAKKEITSENMRAELDKIEKQVQQEGGAGL